MEEMLHKRFVCVMYSTATEVVLLLKLGGNEVFFDITTEKHGECFIYLMKLFD
jgi:hypothetical protein